MMAGGSVGGVWFADYGCAGMDLLEYTGPPTTRTQAQTINGRDSGIDGQQVARTVGHATPPRVATA